METYPHPTEPELCIVQRNLEAQLRAVRTSLAHAQQAKGSLASYTDFDAAETRDRFLDQRLTSACVWVS